MLQYAVTMRKYRVAVIGRTGHGNYGHMLDRVWKLFPNTQVAAVADDNPEGLKKETLLLGAPAAYTDYREMLPREKPDIVAVAPRWTAAHEAMVTAAAESGAVGIYCEKPLAQTPAEADRMIAACDRRGVKLAVAHQMRIAPVIELAKQQVREGRIGQVLEMRGRGKEDKRAGGEDLMILGTHVFDLMRQFAGDPMWAFGGITAGGERIKRRDVHPSTADGLDAVAGDAVAGMFGFRDGLAGYFASRRSDDASGKRWGLDIFGSRGAVAIRAEMEPMVYILDSPEWTNAAWTRLALPGNPPPRDVNEANRAIVADLLAAIDQNREPIASGRQALWTIEMAMALYESERTGGRVPFPLKNREHPLLS